MKRRLVVSSVIALALAAPAGASVRLFSYDPANSDTRHAAGGLTFQFNQGLFSTRLVNVRATEGKATADLAPAAASALGPGGLGRLIGAAAGVHDLYVVLSDDEGPAFTAAFCPGSKKAWMAVGRLKVEQDLRVYVIGDSPAGGPTTLCTTLDFHYHGEWKLPPPDHTYDTRQLEEPVYPH